jgi:membrane protease YdiL (CAAX protease family)
MIDNIQSKKTGRATILTAAELIALLLLPLPFLNLNIIYVVSALVIMLLSKYLRKEKWSDYGFKAVRQKEILLAIAIGIIFGFVDNFLLEPILTKIVGAEPDLSSYEGVKGNVMGLIGMLALGWIVGGLFEEFFFRGYLYYRISSIFTNPVLHKWISILVTSIVFAFAHNYQGIGGIADTFLFSIVLGLLYFYLGKNVWYLILIHGFYDTVGIFRLFLEY